MFDLCSPGNSVYWEERRIFLNAISPPPRGALTRTTESGAQEKGSTGLESPARFLKDVWVLVGGGGAVRDSQKEQHVQRPRGVNGR